MSKAQELEGIFKKVLEQFGSDEDLLKLLDPCTKLVVTATVVRGQVSVQRKVVWDVKEQVGAHLADESRLTQKDWATVLSLKPFSEGSDSPTGHKMRKALLELKLKKSVSHSQNFGMITVRINEVLKASGLAYRVISFKPEGGWYEYKLTKII